MARVIQGKLLQVPPPHFEYLPPPQGVGPTTQRAALLTASQLSSYDHTKHVLLNAGILKSEGIFTHFV